MRYIIPLAIFATAFAAPAPEHQVVMHAPATHNEDVGTSPHIEVNIYLDGVQKETPVSDAYVPDTRARCYGCSDNPLLDTVQTQRVCERTQGEMNMRFCSDGSVGICENFLPTKEIFELFCSQADCKGIVDTCASNPDKQGIAEKDTPVLDAYIDTPFLRCTECGSIDENVATDQVCRMSLGNVINCEDREKQTCMDAKRGTDFFKTMCKNFGCKKTDDTCRL